MRIISGSLKGRSISVPKNFKGRPTTDFAREGLFNVLNHLVDFHQLDVLDLFSGQVLLLSNVSRAVLIVLRVWRCNHFM
jgi:16S rRNA G966 N2-methylase RsmD